MRTTTTRWAALPARVRPTTSSSSPTTTRRSRRSSSGSRATASTRATRSSSSPSTRAITSQVVSERRSRTARSRTRIRRARRPSRTCPANQIGEVTTNLKSFAPTGSPSFDLHFDDAPTIYVNGQPDADRSCGAQRSSGTSVALRRSTPYVNANVPLAQRLADTVEEKTLHMVNADPKRTPTFTFFGNSDFFFQASNPTACGDTDAADVRRPEVRLEPRRLPGRDRQHVARHGRPRRRA